MTSPHLVSITERIKINGREISEKDFARHSTIIRETSEKLTEKGELETVPTFFEQITAIALLAFSEAKVELAILETGLGGRFDATTAANAEIVAITPIDYDHQQILGNTLTKIAAEKAAIIREGVQVYVAPQKREAKSVILGRCREVGVEPIFASNDFIINKKGYPFEKMFSVIFKTENNVYPKILLKMLGRHQLINASLAITVAEALREFGFKITPDNIKIGLENAQHKGRLEFWNNFLFDGAHNISGAKALRDFLNEFIEQPIAIVFGAMRDKDSFQIAEILFPKAEFLIFTKPDNPRSMETSELLKFVPKDFDEEKVFVAETVKDAIIKASELTIQDGLVLITGSLYLVGEAQYLLTH
jgi:dihydrofolate synthase/folylpolyglutamate synthase